jgi:HD-GYP domain-containing protein (c-di-GMP phosphodiesterase class II)
MAASAIQRTTLHEETIHRVEQLQALQMIDRVINASFDVRMTLNLLLNHVSAQLKVDAAAVLLLDSTLQTLNYVAGSGFSTHGILAAHVQLGENYAGRAALERRSIHVEKFAPDQVSSKFAEFWASEGFTTYYCVPLIAKGVVKGVLEVFHRTPLAVGPDWIDFCKTLAGQAAIAIDNAELFEDLQRSNLDLSLAYEATIEGWSRALDMRDRETEGHTLRVAELTERMARAMNISEAEIIHIHRGALLHDIGKMGVPDSILLKPGKLTPREWKLMQMHPQLAYDLISPIRYLYPSVDIPYCHHEKWDGTGYPRKLKGEQIPLAARLFAVVDVWDALTSDRPYRKAWPDKKALDHICKESGKHFDPEAVKLFLRVGKEKLIYD